MSNQENDRLHRLHRSATFDAQPSESPEFKKTLYAMQRSPFKLRSTNVISLMRPDYTVKAERTIEPTAVEKRKLRQVCVSGHLPGEEASCWRCRTARFNTLVSGYWEDPPTLDQFTSYVAVAVETSTALKDFQFVLEYLGLSTEAIAEDVLKFVNRVRKIEWLSALANNVGRYVTHYAIHPLLGQYVPLAPLYQGKTGMVASVVFGDPELRDIYQNATLAGFDAEADTMNYNHRTAAFLSTKHLPDKVQYRQPSFVDKEEVSTVYVTQPQTINYHDVRSRAERRGNTTKPKVKVGMSSHLAGLINKLK